MNLKIITIIAFGALLLLTAACEKADSNTNFGYQNIYMPQATMAGGYYYVPSGNDSSTFNYTIDSANNKLNIMLGVLQSGKTPEKAYPVTITTNADTVATLLNNGGLDSTKAMLLPDSDYTLPAQVQVLKEGQFFLTVAIDKLKMYSGKKMVLAVKINAGSKQQTPAVFNTTIVVIDVDALHL